MRAFTRAVVALAAVALVVPVQGGALAAGAPVLTALTVTEHVVSSSSDAALQWSADLSVPLGELSVDFVNGSTGHTLTARSAPGGDATGTLVIPAGSFEEGIYYAESARIADSAGGSSAYQLYENAPLLDDVWFAVDVAAPALPSMSQQLVDALGGPGGGEISVACNPGSGRGLPILDFEFTAVPVAGGPTVVQKRAGPSCSKTLTGLVAGAAYDITVRSRTAVGPSEPSQSRRATALAAVPAAPTGLGATPGDESVDLTWSKGNSYGKPILNYALEIRSATGVDNPGMGPNDDELVNFTVGGLRNGVTYDFRVRARTDLGWGAWSTWSDPFVPTSGQVPTAPSADAVRTSEDRIGVQWFAADAPASDPATGYEVEVTGSGLETQSGEVTCCTWTTEQTVDPDLSYDVRVRARNSAGWSSWSSTVTVLPRVTPPPPSPVQNLVAVGRVGRLGLSWDEPTTGLPSGGYRYAVLPGRTVPGDTAGTTTTQRQATVLGVTPGEDYVAAVWAVDGAGATSEATWTVVSGTAITLRGPEPMVAGKRYAVTGRVRTTFDGVGVGGATVLVQRQRADGDGFRSIGVEALTRPRGWFDLAFVPKAGVVYRVALVGSQGLGGSAVRLPMR